VSAANWIRAKRKVRREARERQATDERLTQARAGGYRPECDECGTQQECRHRSRLSPREKERYDLNLDVHRSPWLMAPAWCRRGRLAPKYDLEL
jgi:hypothetical protein